MCDGRGIIDREVCERCRGTGSATVDSIPLVDNLALAGVAPTSPASPARVVTFKRSGTQVCVGNLSKGKMGSGQTPTGFTDVRIDRQTALGNLGRGRERPKRFSNLIHQWRRKEPI